MRIIVKRRVGVGGEFVHISKLKKQLQCQGDGAFTAFQTLHNDPSCCVVNVIAPKIQLLEMRAVMEISNQGITAFIPNFIIPEA